MTGGQDVKGVHVKPFLRRGSNPDPELHRTSVFDRRLTLPKGDHRSVHFPPLNLFHR
jgi:hypothetical protein